MPDIIGRYLEDGAIVRASDGATVPAGHRWHDELLALQAGGDIIEPWEPGAEPLPALSQRQLGMMLVMIEIDEIAIETAITTSIADPQEQALALVEFRKAQHYERDHWLVAHLAAALEFEPGELDTLWAYAAGL